MDLSPALRLGDGILRPPHVEPLVDEVEPEPGQPPLRVGIRAAEVEIAGLVQRGGEIPLRLLSFAPSSRSDKMFTHSTRTHTHRRVNFRFATHGVN